MAFFGNQARASSNRVTEAEEHSISANAECGLHAAPPPPLSLVDSITRHLCGSRPSTLHTAALFYSLEDLVAKCFCAA
jgi:hypothetical protein